MSSSLAFSKTITFGFSFLFANPFRSSTISCRTHTQKPEQHDALNKSQSSGDFVNDSDDSGIRISVAYSCSH